MRQNSEFSSSESELHMAHRPDLKQRLTLSLEEILSEYGEGIDLPGFRGFPDAPQFLDPGPHKPQLLPPAWPGAAFVSLVLEPLSQPPCFTHALHYEHKSPAETRSQPPGLRTVSKGTELSLTSPNSWL